MIFGQETSPYNSPIGWLKQFNPGATLLGAMGNFLGKMPDVLQKALMLDIETSGVGKHHVIFEAALYDLSNNRTIEYSLAPARVVKEQSRKVARYLTSLEELESLAQPWSRERIQKGQFSYLKDYFSAVESNPLVLEELKSAGKVTVGGRTYLSPETFFTQLSKDISGAKGIYAANLAFENRQLGALFETIPSTLQTQIKQQFLSAPAQGSRFLYRTLDIHPYTSEALKSRTPTAWAAVASAYMNPSAGGIRTGDIFDIARSSMANANLQGFVKTKDFFTGIGVETLGQAFGLTKQEAHRASADAELQGRLYKRLLTSASNLRAMEQGGTAGFLTAFKGLFGGSVVKDVKAFQRIEALQPTLKKENVQRHLAHFELALRKEKVDPFIIRDQHASMRVAQIRGGKTIWSDINYKTGPDVRTFGPHGRKSATNRFLRSAEDMLGTQGYSTDIAQELSRVSKLTTEELWSMYEPASNIAASEARALRNMQIMQSAPTWSRSHLLKYLLNRYKIPMFGVALGGSILLSRLYQGMFSGISSNDDDYNTLTGMQEGGLAQELRHTLTEFGSGWRGIGSSLIKFFSEWSASPIFIKDSNVYDQLAKFAGSTSSHGFTTSIERVVGSYSKASNVLPKIVTDQLGEDFTRLVTLSKGGAHLAGVVNRSHFTVGSWADTPTTALHEFGHILTMSRPSVLSSSSENVIESFVRHHPEGAYIQQLRNKMYSKVAMHYNAPSFEKGIQLTDMELAAESVSMALQRKLSLSAKTIADEGIARGYYAAAITPSELLASTELGSELLKNQFVLQRLSNISGKDDIYNVIEGLPHGGTAQMLRNIFTEFGSGWIGSTLKAFKSVGSRIKGLFANKASQVRNTLPEDISSITFFGSSKLRKVLASNSVGVTLTGAKFEDLVSNVRGKKLSSEIDKLRDHISKVQKVGVRNVPIVFNRRGYSVQDMSAAAFHEYGHAITLHGVGYRKEASEIYSNYIRNKDLGFRKFRDLMLDSVKAQGGNVSAEMMAESVSVFRQRMAGIKQPRIARAYFSELPTDDSLDAMWKFGQELSTANNIPGFDDHYNIIEALRHGGHAEAMRKGMRVQFGSGWTRDVNWTLPYEMSRTENQTSQMYIDSAYDLTRSIMRSQFTPPGLWATGHSMNVYNASLAFSTPDTRSNIRNRYETSGMSSNIAGFSEQGMAGAYRSWNTGFGSGWKGLISTRDASTDFSGYREPTIGPNYSGGLQYYNIEGYNFPPVEIPYQSVSPTRYMVDSIGDQMTQQTANRRVEDYFRKQKMAQDQITTSMKAFHNANKGARKHINGGR